MSLLACSWWCHDLGKRGSLSDFHTHTHTHLQVPVGDNFYAALNSAVFSDGSFVYVPKGVRSPMELSTYFRINASETGQVCVLARWGALPYSATCLTATQMYTHIHTHQCAYTLQQARAHNLITRS
jgi:Fe-S cluster assembly scaffold protein SufB